MRGRERAGGSSVDELSKDERRQRASEAMTRHAQGNQSAFVELYELTSDLVYRYIARRVRDGAVAEDLMQQTFLKMHNAAGSFIAGADLYPWMYAIARCLTIDWSRQQGREVSIDGAEGRKAPEPVHMTGAADELLQAQQLHARIEAAFRRMPELQRAAFELTQLEELSYAQTAEAIGKTVPSVTALVNRAKKALERAARSEGEED